MLSNNVPTTFLVDKSDVLPVSGRSGLNLNVRVMHCLMEDHVTSLHDLFTASTKRSVEQIFINKI